MKVLSLFTTTALLSMVGLSSAADKEYEYGKDPKKDAEYDISMGMAGIQQAAQDPKLLAQLFQDMQVSVTESTSYGVVDGGNFMNSTNIPSLVEDLPLLHSRTLYAHSVDVFPALTWY